MIRSLAVYELTMAGPRAFRQVAVVIPSRSTFPARRDRAAGSRITQMPGRIAAAFRMLAPLIFGSVSTEFELKSVHIKWKVAQNRASTGKVPFEAQSYRHSRGGRGAGPDGLVRISKSAASPRSPEGPAACHVAGPVEPDGAAGRGEIGRAHV